MSGPPARRLVVDVDGTICRTKTAEQSYAECEPDHEVIARLRAAQADGAVIVLYTARQMRTYHSSIGLINQHMLPVLLQWLAEHDVPHDEIHVGKPWCGERGYYVDDRAVRPSEFVRLTDAQIDELLADEAAG